MAASVGPRRAFHEGVLVEATNPKTAASFIPQFLDLSRGHVAFQFMALGFMSVALNTFADTPGTLAASRIRDSATARPSVIRRLREISGGAMIALGIRLALTRRPAT